MKPGRANEPEAFTADFQIHRPLNCWQLGSTACWSSAVTYIPSGSHETWTAIRKCSRLSGNPSMLGFSVNVCVGNCTNRFPECVELQETAQLGQARDRDLRQKPFRHRLNTSTLACLLVFWQGPNHYIHTFVGPDLDWKSSEVLAAAVQKLLQRQRQIVQLSSSPS